MAENQSVNIRRISRNRAEQVAYYRFLNNENVKQSELSRSLSEACQQQVEGQHVLAISDTTEINLTTHVCRLKYEELGVVGNDTDLGFFLHPTLALNAENGFPLGISNAQTWRRAIGHANCHERHYQRRPIEEKESYKWLRSADQSQPSFRDGGAKLVTYIGDRESDIYEEWATVPDAQTHLLIRARKDRRLWNQEVSLYEYLREQPCQGTCTVEIITDPRIGRNSREAWLSIRATRVEIRRPDRLKKQDYPESLSLYAVEAKEINAPNGQAPIHWRLLTTHQVLSLEQALKIIQWYRWRWRIEQLFGILKQAGLNLEATQLESINAIEKITIFALSVAVRILQLYQGRDKTDLASAIVFSQEQQQCLEQLAPNLEGRTHRQRNPHPPATLAWATWVIARLGGWSGYRSQSPPGVLTLLQGLRKFESLFEGWKLARTKIT